MPSSELNPNDLEHDPGKQAGTEYLSTTEPAGDIVSDPFAAGLDTAEVGMALERNGQADIEGESWRTAEDAEVNELIPQNQVGFRIIEADHTTINGPNIATALTGCKVAVFEVAGGTPADQGRTQEAVDGMLRPDAAVAEQVAASTALRARGLEYIFTTLQNRPESLEKVRILDTGATDPARASVQDTTELTETLDAKMGAFAPNGELRETLVATARQVGTLTAERHALTPVHLHQIAQEEATTDPQVIGVVTGMTGTRTQAEINALGYEASAIQVADGLPKGQLEQLFRETAADPSAAPSPEVVDRALVELIAQSHGLSDQQAFDLSTALPQEQVTELLQTIDEVKASDDISWIDKYAGIREAVRSAHEELQAAVAAAQRGEVAEMAETTVLPQARIRFHFVEGDHSEGNAERIAAALAGCTTVVFESAGGTPEERAQAETAMNSMRDESLSESSRYEAYRYLRDCGMEYIAETLRHLPASVERARLFDVSEDHPSLQDVKSARTLHQIFHLQNQVGLPNAAIRLTLIGYLEKSAEHSIPRETEVMPEQLWRIAVTEAALPPHTIGVVTGAVHAGTRSRMVERGFTCSATMGLTDPDPYVMTTALERRLIQERIRDPYGTFDPVDIDRLLLENIARHHGYDGYQAAALATALPPVALQTVLAEIDGIKQTSLSPDEVKAAICYTILNAPFRFNLTTETP